MTLAEMTSHAIAGAMRSWDETDGTRGDFETRVSDALRQTMQVVACHVGEREQNRETIRAAVLEGVVAGAGYSAIEMRRDPRKRTWCERRADQIVGMRFEERP